jgi:ketosteroid isomerase-like protein
MTDSPNLDLVSSMFAAWERGDFGSAEWAPPEMELVFADGPSPGSWRGLAAMAKGFGDFVSAWEEYRIIVDECRELDDQRVLVLTRRSGRGKASGLELERLGTRGAAIFYVHDGKVTRQVMYLDRDRAVADLGLAPEADSAAP